VILTVVAQNITSEPLLLFFPWINPSGGAGDLQPRSLYGRRHRILRRFLGAVCPIHILRPLGVRKARKALLAPIAKARKSDRVYEAVPIVVRIEAVPTVGRIEAVRMAEPLEAGRKVDPPGAVGRAIDLPAGRNPSRGRV